MKQIELLAPAKDFDAAKAAVLCGADAVYIGADKFSARQAAGNSIETIKKVIDFAHPYYVKVYAAINTILSDNELDEAEQLIHQLYEAGIDGLIIQDVGLLELNLPPLPIIASTQMNNDNAEKIKFLENVGFERAILARELTLKQIAEIRKNTSIELECFVHGALCVGQSGQCYLSYALGGRSSNRGQCAQPCRKTWMLKDKDGKIIARNKFLMSIKDLNLSDRLEDLIDAGVTTFKIEGRLKDADYVANVVGFYRQKLDGILKNKNLQKSSSGSTVLNFKPNLHNTFNRGYTDYGIDGQCSSIGSIDTPKSVGEFIGTVETVDKNSFTIKSLKQLNNADGICFFNNEGNLCGTLINQTDGSKIYPQKIDGIVIGQKIYRNYDHNFAKELKNPAQRKIDIRVVLRDTANGVEILAIDEDKNTANFRIPFEKIRADKKQQAQQTITAHLKKFGNTIFDCQIVQIQTEDIYFFPISTLNNLKRIIADNLYKIRLENRPVKSHKITPNETPYPQTELTYQANILNEKAKSFYNRHGVLKIQPAAESGLDMHGNKVMTTKYCLLNQLGLCNKKDTLALPLYLVDEYDNKFRLELNCQKCGMNIWY